MALNPTNTVYGVKRLIGRKFEDPSVQQDMRSWPFEVINEKGKPKVKVKYKGETKTFFPEEISAMVLTKMKETAEAYLGKNSRLCYYKKKYSLVLESTLNFLFFKMSPHKLDLSRNSKWRTWTPFCFLFFDSTLNTL